MDIYILNFQYISSDVFNRLVNYTSEKRQDSIKRLRFNDDKYRMLMSELLIRYIIMKILEVKNQEIKFKFNMWGKPKLENHENFNFNISHSGKIIACGVDKKPVGIDIEEIQKFDYLSISKDIFSTEEFNLIKKVKDDEQLEEFYKLWTMKESFVKLIGKGMSIPFKDFIINFNGDKAHTIYETEKYYFAEESINSDYKLSVCSGEKDNINIINLVIQNDLIDKFLN